MRNLIYRILAFVFIILYIWFADYFSYHLWILVIFLDLFIFALFIILFFIRRKKLIDKKHRIINLILIIMIIAFALADKRVMKAKLNVHLYGKQINEIVEKVKNEEFSYSYGKTIELLEYSHTSLDGKIYVYQNDDDQVISFLISSISTAGSSELIYSSKEEELIKENIPGIERIIKIKEHWYYVRKKW